MLFRELKALEPNLPKGYDVIREPFMIPDCFFQPKAGATTSDEARGDILIRKTDNPDAKVVVDLTYVDPTTADRLPNTSKTSGYAAQEGYTKKEAHYYTSKFHMGHNQVLPVAIELGGRMHPRSKARIMTWMEKTVEEGEEGESEVYVKYLKMAACRRVLEGLSVELQRSNARSVLRLAREAIGYPVLNATAVAGTTPVAPVATGTVQAAA